LGSNGAKKATIYVEGRPHEVKAGQNLLHACLTLGFDIPYFCWHPALDSIGACRLCAVKQFKDEGDTRGKIVMSCMVPAEEGVRISIEDPEAREFRARVIEWLMLNHPHDCPVCDEGGECHLQDMTVMTGHAYRRTRFRKRTYRNQNLGPLVNHEMNRCIQCYRCVRFYRDYAGGKDLDVFGAHDHVYFGRHEEGTLQSEFSGNLVEVCPTGVFTDKTLKRHYTRKWDLQSAPSVCVHCGLGCNIIAAERYGALRRVLSRYHGEVNGYFICDRGRFSYGHANSPKRVRQPLIKDRRDGHFEPIEKDRALERMAGILFFGANVIGIGSPRASLEANFALRALVGKGRFYSGLSEGEQRLVASVISILERGPAPAATLQEAAGADAVFVLGVDPANEAPMLDLYLRQAARQKPLELVESIGIPRWHDAAARDVIQFDRGPLFVATTAKTKLDGACMEHYRGTPEDLARLGFAVAHEIDQRVPPPENMKADDRSLALRIAGALVEARRPLVVSGTGAGSEAVLEAAANAAWALRRKHHKGGVFFTVPECNTIGLGLLSEQGLAGAFEAARQGKIDAVIVLENDLYLRADAQEVDRFLEACGQVIVIDFFSSRTFEKADIFVPSGSFAEGDGTLVNNEGRAQRFFRVFAGEGEPQESWRWLRDMMAVTRRAEAGAWKSLDSVIEAMAEETPVFRPVVEAAPLSGFRVRGLKVPRQSHRASGRTAMHANLSVHEPKPPEDPDSALSYSMEGYEGTPPPALIPRYWAPGWNSVQAMNRYQREVAGPLLGGDPGSRLLEPRGGSTLPYFHRVPEPFAARKGQWLFVALHHIYGSEEISTLSPDMEGLSEKPYLALCPADAKALGLREGEEAEVEFSGASYRLPLRLRPDLREGVAGLPVLPGVLRAELPAWGGIRKAGDE
jgi:NADH-quinone oxidoreductase subunit G